MVTMQDVVRKITIQASQTGVDQTSASLLKLVSSQDAVAVASERTIKSTLSAQSALNGLQRSVDAEYRAEQQLEKAQHTLTAARNQGLISIQRENELLTLAAARYKVTGEAALAMGEHLRTAKELAIGLVTGLGAGFLIAGLAELPGKIKETVEAAAGLKESAETIGITAKSLQELRYAGSQAGVSTESMSEALTKFSKNLGLAATGSGELAKILKANHVIISGDMTKDFLAYADLVQHATSAEQRNMLTTAAFGKSGAEMGRLFNEGGMGIRHAADEADNLGVVLGDTALSKAKDLEDQFASLQLQLGTSFAEFTLNIAPDLVAALEGITAAVKAANAVINISKTLMDNAGNASSPLAERSSEYLKSDIALMQNLLDKAKQGGVIGLIAGGRGGGAIAVDQAQLAADQAELLRRDNTPDHPRVNDGATRFYPPATITQHGGAGGAGSAAAQVSAYKSVTDALNQQLAALHETDLQKQIDNELSRAKVTASSAEGKAITTLTTEIYNQKKALDAANQASAFFAQTAETAFEGLITGGQSLTDVLGNVLQALEAAVLQAALLGSGPLAGLLGTAPTTAGGTGGVLGDIFSALIPHAKGGVYDSASLSAYSNSIVSKPTPFRFATGAGLMGEAGPEAIMPLKRGADGRLGVAAANSNDGLTVNVQIIRQPGSGEDSATVTRNGKKIDVKAFIKDTAAESAAQPGGAVNRAMRIGFGAKQSLTGRGQ